MLPKWYPNRYDELDGDFVGRHVAAIAGHSGAEVAVLYAAVARGPLPGLIEAQEDLAGPWPTLRYYYRAAPTGWAVLDKPLKLLLYFWCLGRGFRRLRRHWGGVRPDVVHVHVLLRTGVFAWVMGRLHGIPYVITEHWTRYLPAQARGIGRARRWLTAAVVRRAAALHTVSENLREALALLGAVNFRSVVIPNVVDTAIFFPTPMPATPPEPTRWLFHAAAFNNNAKNLTGLLAVVAQLRATGLDVRLRVAGYGPDEALVHRTAAELGLLASPAGVAFVGKLTQAEVAAEMRRAHAFVLFSNYENLPCVLIEAQASGLPVVATRVGGVAELVPADGSRGLLVAAGDEAALARALQEVLAAPPGRFDPGRLRREAVARFGYAAVGPAFGRLYRQVLGRADDTAQGFAQR